MGQDQQSNAAPKKDWGQGARRSYRDVARCSWSCSCGCLDNFPSRTHCRQCGRKGPDKHQACKAPEHNKHKQPPRHQWQKPQPAKGSERDAPPPENLSQVECLLRVVANLVENGIEGELLHKAQAQLAEARRERDAKRPVHVLLRDAQTRLAAKERAHRDAEEQHAAAVVAMEETRRRRDGANKELEEAKAAVAAALQAGEAPCQKELSLDSALSDLRTAILGNGDSEDLPEELRNGLEQATKSFQEALEKVRQVLGDDKVKDEEMRPPVGLKRGQRGG